jgi:hypothetical protein
MQPLIAHRVNTPLAIDGRLSETAWQCAPKSPRFVEMSTGDVALYDTRAAVLWDDANLYVGFWVEEPYPTAHLTKRDSIIFSENDVEVFIDGGDCYYEFEVNARNTIYEVFFIWCDAWKKGGRFDTPEFDVHGTHAYKFGGNFDRAEASFWRGSHPRGLRWAFTDWDFPGIQSATHIDGELNNPSVISNGWRCVVAFPWAGMAHLANGRSLPPKHGDEWRLFLGRFQKLRVAGNVIGAGWSASPHGGHDTHMPEKFTTVRFDESPVV